MKQCTDCGLEKPLSDYYRQTKQKTGLNPRCKICVNRRNRAYAEANPERTREWSRRRNLRAWAKVHLGLDDATYMALLARADGRCEVCGRPERTVSGNGHSFGLALDHNHATGAVRGILCRPCNVALGAANDDAALLRKLADYLEDPPGIPDPAEFVRQVEARRLADGFGQTKRPATGWSQTSETRSRIAAAHTGKQSSLKGVPRSPEVIAKISAGQKGKKRSDEARANMRAARLRYLGKAP